MGPTPMDILDSEINPLDEVGLVTVCVANIIAAKSAIPEQLG